MKTIKLKELIKAEDLAKGIWELKQYSMGCVRNEDNPEDIKIVHRAKLDAYQKVLDILINLQAED